MSADHILDMAREVELRVRERALTAALTDTLRMLDAAYRQLGMQMESNKRVIAARAALALPGAPA